MRVRQAVIASTLALGALTTGCSGTAKPANAPDRTATVYALDVPALDLESRVSAGALERALGEHVLANGTITGAFGR